MDNNNHREYMLMAIELAKRAIGRTNPNPLVGAVITKNNQIVGRGFHIKAGTAHAEINALNEAGEQARDATIYVTLEPCSHYGKTPPCADAIIKAGVKKAIIASLDPNPLVAGRGAVRLKNAGIQVEIGLLKDEAIKINQTFFKYIKTGIPYISLKTAMTLDGKIATNNGDSKWITNEESRYFVHELRNIYDGILVGIGTVLKDNPVLNTRLNIQNTRNPVRLIIDENLIIPNDSNIVKTSLQQRTIIFTSKTVNSQRVKELTDYGIEIEQIDTDINNRIPLNTIIKILPEKDIYSVLVEGGGEINGSVIKDGLLDKVYWFIAPKIIGGINAPTPVGGSGFDYIKDSLKVKRIETTSFSDDLLINGYTRWW